MAQTRQGSGLATYGTLTGTGAVINLQLGFVPQYFRLVNTTTLKTYEWVHGMTADYAFETETASGNNVYQSGGFTEYESPQPTVSSGTTPSTGGAGISIGTGCQALNNACFYVAIA